ncbi:hypothetical protein FHG66_20535 [Rubellimicrobium rubrum]|uniref:Uncharacterized protein n=1 Tax=Rubellimicrobium rubrum TaxID=2585369 RepID=A0A5C4MM37_9RHOB|nr:hypothetical protein [Rubellimicrobium rubrum]TNC44699.1 hypothetical protein FHG66_20535 [Rubellimicrobium rubrum]
MRPRPPAAPTSPDADLRDTLDLLSQVVAILSDRLDRQTATLDWLAKGQLQAHAATSPDHVAAATAQAVTDALGPRLTEIVDAMEELNGTKAVLRERWRIVDREEARLGRWRVQPWAVVAGIPLALVIFLAFTVPRAVAQTSFTCRATGGTWWEATERYPAICLFATHGQNEANAS